MKKIPKPWKWNQNMEAKKKSFLNSQTNFSPKPKKPTNDFNL